jgi:biotin carboxyl carrier protein
VKVTLVLDGERREVEVDLAKGIARTGGVELPVRVVASSGNAVELEVAGERMKVDGWSLDQPSPTAPVVVDGERYRVTCDVSGADAAAPAPPAGAALGRPALAPSAGPTEADAVLPPMPGKVVEVRVQEGDRVEKGAVLLILEAMKMRNEVTAPRAGVVRRLNVAVGTSVRAREPMLFLSES